MRWLLSLVLVALALAPAVVVAGPLEVLRALDSGARSGALVGPSALAESATTAPANDVGAVLGATVGDAANTARTTAERVSAEDPADPVVSALSDDPRRRSTEESMFGSDDTPIAMDNGTQTATTDGKSDREQLEDDMFGGGGSDRDRMEDDMFGGDDDDAGSDDSSRDTDIFGGGTPSGSLFDMSALEDTLAIGGQLYMRLDYSFREGDDAETSTINVPALVDLYLDARPNDRLRAYIRGRLRQNFSVQDGDVNPLTGEPLESTSVDLDQLWLKFDIARTVFVTLGQQAVRWGTGRFWNPTDFLNQQVRDPLAVFDERLGVRLIKLHIPVEGGLNFYAIADFGGANNPKSIGAAVRAEYLFDLTEIAISAAGRDNNPWRIGADVSTGIWLLDLRAEAAVRYDDKGKYYRGDFDLASFTFPTEVDRSGEWLPSVSAGFEIGANYSDEDAIYFGGEYFYNHAGYDDSSIIPWLIFNEAFSPLYTGKHYGAFYIFLPTPGDLRDTSFTLSTLGNLNDPSFVTRFDYRVSILTYLSLNAYTSVYYGNEGEFRLGLEVPSTTAVEGLENGLSVKPPVFDLGFGAILRL